MPLRLIECQEFRTFLTYLNGDIDHWLPSRHDTVQTWVMCQFGIEKEKTKIQLQNSKTKIYLSLDISTSPNNKPILGVVAYYISDFESLEHIVLAMKEIEGKHKGENLALVVMAVIRDWGIGEKLGYIVMDNASNNDSMMQYISEGKLILPKFTLFYSILANKTRDAA
jgi:hypothetical protein